MNDDLTCEQADSLLPAYATSSLVAKERCGLLGHLAECRLHDEEVAAYRGVSSRLPAVIAAVQPPPRLRSDLLRNFDVLANSSDADATDAPQRQATRRSGFLQAPSFAYGLAAALAVVAIALASFALGRSGGADTSDGGVMRVANSADGGRLQLTYLQESDLGVIDLQMPALPPNRVYQAWQITDSGPASLGIVNASGPTAFSADLARAQTIAITVEPLGGSAQPTTTPLLVTKL